jgi:hypothetical protein
MTSTRPSLRSLLATAAALALSLAVVPACGDDVPSCDDLQEEANGCNAPDPATKAQYSQVKSLCEAEGRFDDDCRKCLKGKICGNTEACDSACGK